MERKNPFLPLDQSPLPGSGARPLEVALLRGSAIESRHRVHVQVVDSGGGELHRWGDPSLVFFPRSAVKLIQAAAWVSRGHRCGAAELAIACGSHQGESRHVEVVGRWLGSLGLGEGDLECGPHEPTHRPSARALARKGEEPCQLHNNCSGKHCGLLTACLAEGWPVAGYTNYDHPVQALLRNTMGDFFGLDLSAAPWGIDGCGIPTHAVSLGAMARAMALSADPGILDSRIQEAVRSLNGAIAAHPEMIGGAESFSSQVVGETEGRVFAKLGAEGVYGAWIPAEGLGIAVKCEDGQARAAEAALAVVLAELGHPLRFFSPLVRRWTGEVVGQFLCG